MIRVGSYVKYGRHKGRLLGKMLYPEKYKPKQIMGLLEFYDMTGWRRGKLFKNWVPLNKLKKWDRK